MKNIYTRFIALLLPALLISAALSAQVDVTTGGPATTYNNIKLAFDAINSGTHTGAITISITGTGTYSDPAAPAVLNSSGAGSALYTSILIRPTADNVSIFATTLGGRGVIELKGADNVTIDGDNPNTSGTNRNLTIYHNAAATTTYTSVIRICNATAVVSSDNITVRNCVIRGNVTGGNLSTISGTTSSSNASFGIYCGGNGGTTATDAPTALTSVTTNTAPATTTINNLVVDNNTVNQCARGIVFNGASTAVSTGITITNNTLGGAGTLTGVQPFTTPTTTVYTKGIYLAGTNAVTVTGNTLQNIMSYVATLTTGIELASAIGNGTINISSNNINGVCVNATSSAAKGIVISSAAGNPVVNLNTITNIQTLGGSSGTSGVDITFTGTSASVSQNTISKIYNNNTGGWGSWGLNIAGGTAATITNNMVFDIFCKASGSYSTTFGNFGIRIAGGTGHKVYYNSVYLTGAFANSAHLAAAFGISGTGQTGLDVRNNVFANAATTANTTSSMVSIYLPAGATSAMNLTLNNNAYYSGASAVQGVGQAGTTFGTNFFLTLNALKTYSSTLSVAGTNDNASFGSTLAPPFTSATDLHIPALTTTQIESGGVIVDGTTTDYDGQNRYPVSGYPDNPGSPANAPDMGADEFAGTKAPVCSGTPAAATITGVNAVCTNTGTTLSLSNTYTDLGITYQWKYATASGGPYTNLGTASTQATGNLTVATYYVCDIICTLTPATYTTAEKAISINALPAVAVDPVSGSYCTPGGSAVTLTASNAVTYAWSPATGLDATTGAVVHASPSLNTTYTVTGTDANGCINTATSVITVGARPVISATATPDNVCINGTSQLLASGYLPGQVKTYTFTAGTEATLDPMTGATQVIGSGNDDTPTALPLSIGFTFNYDGVNYTQYSVSPDGWLLLGPATAVSQFSNSTTSTTNIPKLYPYWDDLATGTTGYVKTLVTGSAPNRIFIAEWYVTIPRNTTGAANSTMQAWLYEASGKVEFRYGTMGAGTMSASVGLSGSAVATNFNSVTVSTGTNSIVTAYDANAGQPASGTIYTFTPGVPSVTWTPTTFLNFSNILNPVASNMTESTTYTVTAANGGCTSTANVTVTVGSELFAGTAATPGLSVCNGTQVALTGIPSGGGGPYSYSWKLNGDEIGTTEVINVTPEATTTYDLTITDFCLQVATTSVTITVKPVPTASATNDSPLCAGSTVHLYGTTDFGTSFNWTGPGGFTSTDANPVITSATPAASGTYVFTATFDGCTSPASGTAVVVNYNPTAITITPSPVAMKAGTVQSLTATGGTTPATLLTENFNSPPVGWTTYNGSTGGTPATAAWSLYLSSPTFQSNDNSMFVLSNSDGQGSGGITRTQLISPVINTTGYASLSLSFWHHFRIYTSVDIGKVEVSTDGGETWDETTLATYNATVGSATAWVQATLDMSAYINQPNLQFRFNYYADWGYYWGIDNVSVTGTLPSDYTWAPFTDLYTDNLGTVPYTGSATPTVYTKPAASIVYTVTATSEPGCTNTNTVTVTTCPDAPATPIVSNITPFAFDLSWTYAAGTLPSGYTIEVATDDLFENQVAGSPFTVAYPTQAFFVTGLSGSTLYYYRISANGACSSDYATGTVTTLCPPVAAPFVEDFETGGFAPACWANVAVTGSFTWNGSTAASANGIGTASAMANFFDQSSGTYELKTKPFDISGLTTPTLKFNFAYASYVVEIDEMDIYTSADYGKTWSLLLAMPGGPDGILNTAGLTEDAFVPTASQWCTKSLDLPAGTNMVKFTAISAYGNNLYLDNITVSEPVQENSNLQDITVTATESFYATSTLTTAGSGTYFEVVSGGHATLMGGEIISLLPGTRVFSGGYLLGFISQDNYCIPAALPAVIAKEETTGISLTAFSLYPNPTSGNFTLVQKGDRQFDKVTVEVYSMRGEKLVTSLMVAERQHEFNVSDLPVGIYFVKILAEDYTETIKLVKTR